MNWKKLSQKIAAGFLGLTLIFNLSAAQADPSQPTEKKSDAPKVSASKKIVINSASRILALYDGDKKVAIYPLGLGKVSTPTPTGYYKILEKTVNPSWIDPSDPEYEVPSGPDNPLGYRWMQIKGNYGIHGTNKPNSIGYYVSNGCIRMYEKDVEELYDAVEVDTPVEITYNRVVVEKAPDENIVYYIYPDGYGWQDLKIDDVNKWLEPYGVAAFESDTEIAEKIQASDGNPTYVGKPYNIELNGKILPQIELNGRIFVARAVIRENITYLPAVPLAVALNTKVEWRASESTLKSQYGEVTGYEKKKQIYLNADDAMLLFNIDGGLQSVSKNPDDGKIFRLRTVTPPNLEINTPTVKPPTEIDTQPVKPPTEIKKPADKPKVDEKSKTDAKNKTSDKTKTDEKVKPSDIKRPADEKSASNNKRRRADEKLDDDNKIDEIDDLKVEVSEPFK